MHAFSHSKSPGSFRTLMRMRIPGGLARSGHSRSRLSVCLLPTQLHTSVTCGRSVSLGLTRHNSNMTSAQGTSGSKPPLQKRAVVSSFLYKFVQENGERKAKVALFKRSGQVRTYQ